MPPEEDDPVTLSERALIRDIIEFMRAVHAEMAAITSAARRGVALQGTIMYATAFPCHECARHIVAAGISRVYFVDPYPKSRVSEMFDDSISIDEDKKERIPFLAFTGIAPRLYADVFQMPDRKIDDKWIDWNSLRRRQMPRRSVGPVSYLEKEDEAIKLLHTRLLELTQPIKGQ